MVERMINKKTWPTIKVIKIWKHTDIRKNTNLCYVCNQTGPSRTKMQRKLRHSITNGYKKMLHIPLIVHHPNESILEELNVTWPITTINCNILNILGLWRKGGYDKVDYGNRIIYMQWTDQIQAITGCTFLETSHQAKDWEA